MSNNIWYNFVNIGWNNNAIFRSYMDIFWDIIVSLPICYHYELDKASNSQIQVNHFIVKTSNLVTNAQCSNCDTWVPLTHSFMGVTNVHTSQSAFIWILTSVKPCQLKEIQLLSLFWAIVPDNSRLRSLNFSHHLYWLCSHLFFWFLFVGIMILVLIHEALFINWMRNIQVFDWLNRPKRM